MTEVDRPSSPISSVADLAALGRLLEEHRPRLLAMLDRRIDPALGVRIGPDDILNEAFLDARRKWTAFRGAKGDNESPFAPRKDCSEQPQLSEYAWLYRIVLDRLIEEWRKATRGRRDLHREMPWPERTSDQLGMNLVHSGTSPSAAVSREEIRRRVRQILELLKPSDREILDLRHTDQLTFGEAGAILGVPENTAAVRYARALRRLKDLWQQAFGPESI
jgi:RNA polymerase sigma-70 factor (ECF subfamily)